MSAQDLILSLGQAVDELEAWMDESAQNLPPEAHNAILPAALVLAQHLRGVLARTERLGQQYHRARLLGERQLGERERATEALRKRPKNLGEAMDRAEERQGREKWGREKWGRDKWGREQSAGRRGGDPPVRSDAEARTPSNTGVVLPFRRRPAAPASSGCTGEGAPQ